MRFQEKGEREAGEKMTVYSCYTVVHDDDMNLFHGRSTTLNVAINCANYDILLSSKLKIEIVSMALWSKRNKTLADYLNSMPCHFIPHAVHMESESVICQKTMTMFVLHVLSNFFF